MPAILALALGAAVYPQLLAVVVVILTRPEPKLLLWACFLGAVSVSVGSATAILLIFRDRGSFAGSTSHRVGGPVFLVIGAITVLVAMLVATERGRARLGAGLQSVRRPGGWRRERSRPSVRARAERALERGSVLIAAGVGAVLGVPGPFDLLALGRITRGGYSVAASIGILLAFNLVKFALIEVPILSYALDPRGTAARVDHFSTWMKDHQIKALAAVVGVIGLLLIARGVSRLG